MLLGEVYGFEILVACSGADALEQVKTRVPDLFFLDYHLTDMNGADLIRALRVMPACAKTPIVVASGMNVEDAAKEAGADRFIAKPYDPDSLPTLFEALLSTSP